MAAPRKKTDTAKPHLDTVISHLAAHKQEWAALGLQGKLNLLLACKKKLKDCSHKMDAEIAVINNCPLYVAKMLGSFGMITQLNGLEDILVEAVQSKKIAHKHRVGPAARTIVHVTPRNTMESLLSGGSKGEVWSKPGVHFDEISDHQKINYFDPTHPAGIIYVLGAGNVPLLTVSDALDFLYGESLLPLIKVHPRFESLTQYFKHTLSPLIDAGFMDICDLDLEETVYLLHAADIDRIHITGGIKTQEMLAFGAGPEGEKRKKENKSILDKPFTSELGSVTPAIFAPGPDWKEKDVIANIRRVLDCKAPIYGHGCLSTQVLILPKDWKYTQLCKDELKRQFMDYENKYFYPGTKERLQAVLDNHDPATITRLDETDEEGYPGRIVVEGLKTTDSAQLFSEEVFGNAIGIVEIEAESLDDYLNQAIDFANKKLWGNLSGMLIIHPKSIKELGPRFEEHVANYKVGGLAVNANTMDLYINNKLTWGGYAGNPMNDAQGGIGFVHNTTLLDPDMIEKSVYYGPFSPLPLTPQVLEHVNRYCQSDRKFPDSARVMFNLIKMQIMGNA